REPLIQIESRLQYRKVIVRVCSNKSQRFPYTLTLEKAVGSEMTEKFYKILIFIPLDGTQINSLQYPRPLDTLKIILFHHPCLHEYPFHLHGSEGSIPH